MFTLSEVPMQARKGGTTRESVPHVCHYILDGATTAQCHQYSGNFMRNRDGCCAFRCNFVQRLCYRCVEEGRGKKSSTVLDPLRGFCAEHQQMADSAPQQSPVKKIYRGPVIGDIGAARKRLNLIRAAAERVAEGEVGSKVRATRALASGPKNEKEPIMAESTQEECARLRTLDADEFYALTRMAYGFDDVTIDKELARRRDRVSSASAGELLTSCFKKLGLLEIDGDRHRRQKAGKILLDAKEMERTEHVRFAPKTPNVVEEEAVVSYPITAESAEAEMEAVERPDVVTEDRAISEEAEEGVADEATAAPDTTHFSEENAQDEVIAPERDAHSDVTEKDMTVTQEPEALKNAMRIASKFIEARKDGRKQVPYWSEVYTAVRAMLDAGQTLNTVGQAFGYQGSSGTSWASTVSTLSRLDEKIWQLVEKKNISLNVLKQTSMLPDKEQLPKIKEWFANRAGEKMDHEPKPPAPKPENTKNDLSLTVQQHGNGHDTSVEVSRVPAVREEVTLPAAKKEDVGTNQHFATLLPVRVSLQGLGPFEDVDLASFNFGAEFSEQRAAQIAEHRKAGLEPSEIIMHPALPSPQMLYVKKPSR